MIVKSTKINFIIIEVASCIMKKSVNLNLTQKMYHSLKRCFMIIVKCKLKFYQSDMLKLPSVIIFLDIYMTIEFEQKILSCTWNYDKLSKLTL